MRNKRGILIRGIVAVLSAGMLALGFAMPTLAARWQDSRLQTLQSTLTREETHLQFYENAEACTALAFMQAFGSGTDRVQIMDLPVRAENAEIYTAAQQALQMLRAYGLCIAGEAGGEMKWSQHSVLLLDTARPGEYQLVYEVECHDKLGAYAKLWIQAHSKVLLSYCGTAVLPQAQGEMPYAEMAAVCAQFCRDYYALPLPETMHLRTYALGEGAAFWGEVDTVPMSIYADYLLLVPAQTEAGIAGFSLPVRIEENIIAFNMCYLWWENAEDKLP